MANQTILATLLMLAPMVVGAQEVVTLDQSLTLSSNSSRMSLGGMTSSSLFTRSDYQFDLGMPVLSYRLGALDLTGGLGWTRQSGDGGSDSALGLSSLGLAGSLFPYQPYHLSFDYNRNNSPALFGGKETSSDTWGVTASYRGGLAQNLRVAYRRGTITGATQGEYTSFSVSEDERHGRTDLRIRADWQEAIYGAGLPWKSTTANVSATTLLPGDWIFSNNLNSFAYQGSSQAQLGSTLSGSSGGWTSVTALDTSYMETSGRLDRTVGLSQALAHTWGRLSGFTQSSFAAASSSGDALGTPPTANLSLGASYKLTKEWSLMTDLSGAWTGAYQSAGKPGIAASLSRTVHVGASWGAGLSEQLRHAMFYWTNLRNLRRLEEDYPPGYLPPEMMQVQLRRRMNQEGSLNFGADAYQSSKDQGFQRWYRVQGALNLNGGLMVQTIGDYRKDEGFMNPYFAREDRNLTLYGTQSLGRGSVAFSMGHTQNSQTYLRDPQTLPETSSLMGMLKPYATSGTYYSVGTNTFVKNVPVSAYLIRNSDSTGSVTTTLSTSTYMTYGRSQFRLTYQRGWRNDGLRTTQITINLARTFDTIALWGLEN